MKKFLLASAVLSALMVGCDDEPTPPPAPTPEPAAQSEPAETRSIQTQAKDLVNEGKQAVESAVQEAREVGQAVIEEAKPHIKAATTQLKEGVSQVKDGVSQAADAVKDQVKQLTGGNGASNASADEQFDYKKQIEQALNYLKQDKIDLADKTLAAVEARKDSIPESYHARIEVVRTMIDNARKARQAGLSVPRL